MRALIDGDMVTGTVTGQADGGVPFSEDLQGLPLARLRCVDGEIIDVAERTSFWVDAQGRKHVVQADDRQELSCAWDARLVWDAAGQWRVWTPPLLAAVQAQAESAIDAQADALLEPHMSLTPGRVMTYMAKEAQARDFLAAENPDPVDYPLIAGEVGITGDTPQAVAETILTMAKSWQTLGAAVESTRLAAKKRVREATDEQAVQAVLSSLAWPSLG